MGGVGHAGTRARGAGAYEIPPGLIDLTIFHLNQPADAELLAFCRGRMTSTLTDGGAVALGWYVTEPSANTFPRLPVREGEQVLVGLALFNGAAAFDAFAEGRAWAREVALGLSKWLAKPPESHRLVPTARSAIHA